MKQVIQHIRSGKTAIVEAPIPTPGPGMVLVRTAASVISAGTERTLVEFAGKSLLGKARARPDLVRQTMGKVRREGMGSAFAAVRSRLEEAMPLGYASAGTVVEVGEGVEGFRPGDRVACAGGGYAVHAEYAVVPRNLLAILPNTVRFEEGAFATLGAIALHAFRLGEARLGEDVAVIGLGLIGQLATGIAIAAGCRAFGVDLRKDRVEQARQQGAAAVVRAEAESAGQRLTQGRGFDCVLICADGPSNDPLELAAELSRDRGDVVAVGAVGLTVPRKPFYDKELRLIVSRSYGPGRYDPAYEEGGHDYPLSYVRWTEGRNLDGFVNLLADGKVSVQTLITHRYPVAEAEEAYAALAQGALAIVLSYPDPTSERLEPRERRLDFQPARSGDGSVRLGVLGAGNYAMQVALPIVHQLSGVQRVMIASARGLRASEAARRFEFRSAASNEAEVLAHPDVNTIAVMTRHHLHSGQTARALQAGKHVFCEKPLALTRQGVADVAEALAESHKVLMVGFNRRFAPLAQMLKSELQGAEGPMTAQYRVNAGPLPAGHWLLDPEQGGGRILGEVCHFIDLLTFLFDSLPRRLTTTSTGGGGTQDIMVHVEFSNNSLASIVYAGSGDRALPKERLEVFGGGKASVLEDFRRLTIARDGKLRSRGNRLRQDKGHRGAWEAFVAAVTRGGPPPIPNEQLFAVALATLAADESLRSGVTQEVLQLSIGE